MLAVAGKLNFAPTSPARRLGAVRTSCAAVFCCVCSASLACPIALPDLATGLSRLSTPPVVPTCTIGKVKSRMPMKQLRFEIQISTRTALYHSARGTPFDTFTSHALPPTTSDNCTKSHDIIHDPVRLCTQCSRHFTSHLHHINAMIT